MWHHCNNNAISVLQMTTSQVRECGCFLCYKQGHTVKRLSVWNVVMLRLCHCNNNAIKHISILQMITSLIRQFRCFFWSQPGHAVEQLVKRYEIWDTMTLDHVRSITVKTMLQNKARFLQRQTHTSAWVISEVQELVITKITFPVREFGYFFWC